MDLMARKLDTIACNATVNVMRCRNIVGLKLKQLNACNKQVDVYIVLSVSTRRNKFAPTVQVKSISRLGMMMRDEFLIQTYIYIYIYIKGFS